MPISGRDITDHLGPNISKRTTVGVILAPLLTYEQGTTRADRQLGSMDSLHGTVPVRVHSTRRQGRLMSGRGRIQKGSTVLLSCSWLVSGHQCDHTRRLSRLLMSRSTMYVLELIVSRKQHYTLGCQLTTDDSPSTPHVLSILAALEATPIFDVDVLSPSSPTWNQSNSQAANLESWEGSKGCPDWIWAIEDVTASDKEWGRACSSSIWIR